MEWKNAFTPFSIQKQERNGVEGLEREQYYQITMKQIAEESLENEEKSFLNDLMKQGIQKNNTTGLEFFTGYSYATLYDWDQYFEGLIQLYMGWGTKFLINTVKIFLEYQQENGFTKRAINNSATVGVHCEESLEMVKPFLSQITALCYLYDGNLDWLTEREYERLKRSLDYWLYERDENKNGLSRWRSSIETGMDNQHERGGVWRSDFDEGVDLNTYLYQECLAYAMICEYRGDGERAQEYRMIAEQRKVAVRSMWDETDGFFYDKNEKTGEMIRVKSVSGLPPIWAGIATREQADRLIKEHILNPKEFWRTYPLPALAATEPGYRSVRLPGDIGCNWRANTWVPTNYMVTHGLVKYGYKQEAMELAEKTKALVKKSGNREYYITESGEGDGLDPFWGWTLLAYFMEEELKQDFHPEKMDR